MARITTATLIARMDARDAQMDAQLFALTGSLVSIGNALERFITQGQHATPAAVAEITSAPSARNARKALAGAAKAKHEAKVARDAVSTPVQASVKAATKQASTDAYKARKSALSPLNKALFATLVARKLDKDTHAAAWAARYNDETALVAALATLTADERTAALAVLTK